MHRTLAIGLAALVFQTAAAAHDFWIEPTVWTPNAGAAIGVRLKVGDGFPGDPVARNPARIERFIALAPGAGAGAEESPVPGVGGAEPAGETRCEQPGVMVLAYRSLPVPITLEADKFTAYLAEEGLERVIDARAQAGASDSPGREKYSRCAKALVLVGDGPHDGFDRTIGLRLELTPLPDADPFALRADEPFRVRLTFDGRPVEGALVDAAQPGGSVVASRTDADGVAALALRADGFWRIAAMHMIPADAADADWESLWASLTFEAKHAPP